MSLQLYQVSQGFFFFIMNDRQTDEKWLKNCLGETKTFYYSSSNNMWIETTSSSLTFAQLGLDVTRGFCFYAEGHLMWFSSVWPFFPECIKTSFFLFFYSRRWIIKATYWISKVCLWKTRLTRTATEVEELLKILVRLWRTFFFLILFHFIYAKKNSFIFFFFSGAGIKEKEAEVENQMPGGHHTMEFFEMCAALITQLARWRA